MEDHCFDAQQAAEKAVKAILVLRNLRFPKTHDISDLLDILEADGVRLSESIRDADALTVHAVQTRYPPAEEPLEEDEFRIALAHAEAVVAWAEGILEI